MPVLTGAIFHTCDPHHRQTDALACDAQGVIVALGEQALAMPGERIALTGWATPGLTDGHAHLALMARAAAEIDVSGATSADAVLARLEPRNGWVIAHGLGFALDPVVLDAAFPNTPVVIRRLDEHCGVFNTAALGKAGWLYEQAFDTAMRKVPKPPLDLRQAALGLRTLGITAVHDMAVQQDELSLLADLPVRVAPYLYSPDVSDYLHWCRTGVQRIKIFLDGALGSHGALLLAPYSDEPCTHGLRYLAQTEADTIVRAAADAGVQVAMHAIGDAAVREALDLIARYHLNAARIEHAQVVHPDDLPRFAGVFAGVQFQHRHDDAAFTRLRLGDRQAHAWRSLRDHGATLVAGSDAPVASARPVLAPEGLTRQEALDAYTCNAFEAIGEPGGQLRVGLRCELTLWQNDPLSADTPVVTGTWP